MVEGNSNKRILFILLNKLNKEYVETGVVIQRLKMMPILYYTILYNTKKQASGGSCDDFGSLQYI